MRAFKNTSLVWGLASLPIGLASAVNKESNGGPGFKRYVEVDGEIHAIEQAELDAVTGEPVDYDDIKSGLEIDGEVRPIDGDTLSAARAEAADKINAVELIEFIPREMIEPYAVKGAYWVQPQSKFPTARKALKLLHHAMKTERAVAVAKICPRDRQARCVIVPHESGGLQLLTLYWESSLREPDDEVLSPQAETLSADEKRTARALVAKMRTDGEAFLEMDDDLKPALERLLGDAGEPVVPASADAPEPPQGDMMERLQASLAAA